MRKNKLVALALAAALSTVCTGIAVQVEGTSEAEVIQEGYTEESEGYKTVVSWCKNEAEGRNIYGKFYYPADFDESQTYPTIIMSHGLSVTHEIYEKAGWTQECSFFIRLSKL